MSQSAATLSSAIVSSKFLSLDVSAYTPFVSIRRITSFSSAKGMSFFIQSAMNASSTSPSGPAFSSARIRIYDDPSFFARLMYSFISFIVSSAFSLCFKAHPVERHGISM